MCDSPAFRSFSTAARPAFSSARAEENMKAFARRVGAATSKTDPFIRASDERDPFASSHSTESGVSQSSTQHKGETEIRTVVKSLLALSRRRRG